MIKRASTILLTLFLLLSSAQVWGATSTTTFQKKDGVTDTYYELSDIKTDGPFISEIATSFSYTPGSADSQRGKYSVTSSGAEFGYKKQDNAGSMLIKLGLQNMSIGNTYTVTITGKASGDEMQFKCNYGGASNVKVKVNNNDSGNTEYINSVRDNFTLTFTFVADKSTGSVSIAYNSSWDQKDLNSVTFTKITVSGDINPCIVSSNGELICKGEETTFTAWEIGNSVTWTYKENGQTKTATGTSLTFCPTEDQTVKATGTKTLEYKIKTEVCCSKDADRMVAAVETFRMDAGKDFSSVIDLNRGIDTRYQYAGSKKPVEYPNEQYSIMKSTENSFENWYKDNGAHIVKGHTQVNNYDFMTNDLLSQHRQADGKNANNDGFMVVNCNTSVYPSEGAILFIYEMHDVCPNTTHDFSAFVSNLDAKSDEYGVNLAFEVVDGNGVKLLERKETGDIPCGNQKWEEYGGTFQTGNSGDLTLYVYNNNTEAKADPASHKVLGNDVAVDDIVFSRCVPRIYVSFDQSLKNFTSSECDQPEHSMKIYVGHPNYSINEILNGAWYVVQQRKDGGSWEPVKIKNGTTFTTMVPTVFGNVDMKELEIEVTNKQGKTEYRAIVGSSEQTVKDIMENKTVTTGCKSIYNITKSDSYASLNPVCTNPCIDSNKPKMNSYLECPTEAKEIDLTTLIKEINTVDGKSVDLTKISDAGKLSWYKQDPEDETKFDEIKNTKVPFPSQGNKDRYSVSFTQKDDATQTYCISDTTQFTVGIKETIEFDVNTTSIMGCIGDLSSDESRTFKIKNLVPTSLTNNDVNYIWSLLNTETNQYETIATATTDSYIVEPGNGKIKVSITPKNSSVQVCPSTETELSYSIADNPKFELDGVSVPCFDKLKDDGIVVSLKELSGSTMLKIKRTATDENNKVSTSVFTSFEEAGSFKVINYNEEAEFAFKDTYFDAQYFSADFDATKIASVQYDIVLGIETTDCKDEISTETFDISSTNNFSLRPSDNVKDINDDKNIAEYHICEGEQVIVTSTYNEQDGGLKPGEIYEWYVKKGNGEFILDTTDPSLKDSQSYTIPEIDETTTIKVVLVADPNFTGAETCGGEAIITIIVDKKPEVTAENIELCADDKSKKMKVTAKGTYSYEWTPNTGLSNAAIQNPGIISLTTSTDYSLKVTSGTCTITIPEIKVTVIPLPEIGNITVDTDEEGKNVLNVEINGTDTYKYSLDDITYSESTPTNLPIGWNKLYVSDSKGCKSSKLFEVEPTPIYPEKYFTPNGDGVNETWDIENINMYPSYIVEIFDRHGRRLFIQRVGSFNTGGNNTVDGDEFKGWDGMYNGHAMPSDDYWYLITVEEIRKQYTGHFTLKR